MYFVVAYDITQDRRRARVMSALKNFGRRVQFSVFECDLDAARMAELRKSLEGLIDPRRDKVHIYPLCGSCFFRAERLGVEDRRGMDL